jgi:hypothetical protein
MYLARVLPANGAKIQAKTDKSVQKTGNNSKRWRIQHPPVRDVSVLSLPARFRAYNRLTAYLYGSTMHRIDCGARPWPPDKGRAERGALSGTPERNR